ncbi:related to major facilitator MirA [Phialocephala subalpina]|uniref:Related to major facilitator MirA n=1 Tax=Phialocephala subalpina TaxID=576137 RepID=A0A1L7XKQ3_9HELO|nr:related to major facilitator MirA [Phialocephala subalpina]
MASLEKTTPESSSVAGPQNMNEKVFEDAADEALPDGVRRMEAITMIWSKWALVTAYAGAVLMLFWVALLQSTSNSLLPYVTSSFAAHSLVATATMVCFILAGVIQVPLAKVIDVWGRVEGFIAMIVVLEVRLVLTAACKNVKTYTAGMVLYEIGFSGIYYILTVFIADASQMKNRALMIGISYFPNMATTFAGPALAEAFYDNTTWRWAYGMFSTVLPVMCLPVILVLWRNQKKSKKLGIIEAPQSGRTVWQSFLHFSIEFDAIGVILFGVSLTIFLLPFTLASSAGKEWRSATVITMIMLGFVLLLLFVAYEKFFSPKAFIPFSLLKDRTVLGACLFNAAYSMGYFVWQTYYSSYLQVVHDQSIKHAGYIVNIYWNGLAVSGIFAGLLVHFTGEFKKLALAGVSLMTLGIGLLVHFRHPRTDVGYLVMCQLFVAIAGGMLNIAQYMALLVRSATKGHVTSPSVALLLSLSFLSQRIGAAISLCIAGSVWTHHFLGALKNRLPDALKAQAEMIYASIVVQLQQPRGTPIRDAIDLTYEDIQLKLTITGTAVMALAIASIMLWRNIKVTEVNEKKGLVV